MTTPQIGNPTPVVSLHGESSDITDSVGENALGVALARAGESAVDCPLFTDPYAQLFVDAALSRGWQPPPEHMMERIQSISGYSASRTKWFDEFFIAAGANGIEQAVILAAGLDARAWRLPWVAGSAVYEIDQPKVLALKAETLRAHDAQPSARYVQVPADLRRHDWPDGLRAAGFDPSEPAVWAAEGLLTYLPAAGQEPLFEHIHDLSATGSRIAVECFEDRIGVADWLTTRGWEVSVIQAQSLMDRYRRCGTDSEKDAVPHTVFLEGQLVS